MPTSNISNLQRALQSVSDYQLQQALMQPSDQIPQFLLLSEITRRQQMRETQNLGRSRGTSIRQEVELGIYKPVPVPAIGIQSLQVGEPPTRVTTTPQQPQRGLQTLAGKF